MKDFEQKVRSIDWTKYLAPKYYDSEKMYFDPSRPVKALIKLSQINNEDNKLDSEILFAIGNDHRGTYYPAALEAIDLIIEIEKNSDNEVSSRYAKDVLSNLYYFELDMPENDQDLYNSINDSIREKLKPYSDEELEMSN